MQIIKVEQHIFECTTEAEVWRASTLLTKEPGTVAWLRRTLQPGDVFYDVGANIGLYSVLAHGCLQGAGLIVAFEPHVGNCARLLRHLRVNKVAPVQVYSLALSDRDEIIPFHYTSSLAGSSGHQLGHTRSEGGEPFEPVAVEQKVAARVDTLLKSGPLVPATAIKIDVDGNEPDVLGGMHGLLQAPTLRSVQVEIHPQTDAVIQAVMVESGFRLTQRHYTDQGQQAITRGADPVQVPHNAVFDRPS